MLRSSAFRGAAARVFSSVKTAKPMIRSAPSSLPKRFMAHGDVKRHPDLERWNNVRDNIDQVRKRKSINRTKDRTNEDSKILFLPSTQEFLIL